MKLYQTHWDNISDVYYEQPGPNMRIVHRIVQRVEDLWDQGLYHEKTGEKEVMNIMIDDQGIAFLILPMGLVRLGKKFKINEKNMGEGGLHSDQ